MTDQEQAELNRLLSLGGYSVMRKQDLRSILEKKFEVLLELYQRFPAQRVETETRATDLYTVLASFQPAIPVIVPIFQNWKAATSALVKAEAQIKSHGTRHPQPKEHHARR